MKKIRNCIFAFVALCSLVALTGCLDLREAQTTIEPEYTVTFYAQDSSVVKKVTNYVGVQVRDYQIPAVPALAGHDGKWCLNDGSEPDYSKINSNALLYATYEAEKYLVRFYDDKGVAYADTAEWTNNQQVEYGKAAVAPTVTVTGYDVTWDKDFAAVTASIDVNVVLTIKSYNVKFVDWDYVAGGTPLKEETLAYGSNATAPANPTRPATAQYTYTFAGWDTDGDGTVNSAPYKVEGEIVAKAIYTSTVNKYTVKFENYDGTELKSSSVDYGTVPTAPANPTRPATAQYTYTFAGWDTNDDKVVDELVAITGNVIAKAVYTSTVNKYTVTFKDHDNAVLQTSEVEYGAAATAPTNPSRTGYTFKAWDKAFDNIVAALEVKATYTINQYTYRFLDDNGTTVLKEATIDYGAAIVAPANPTKASTAQYDFKFKEWTPTFTTIGAANIDIKASYDSILRSYTYTFQGENGVGTLKTGTGDYGTTAPQPATLPTKTGYSFVGWDTNGDGKSTTADSLVIGGTLVANAVFSINTYTIYGRVYFTDDVYYEREVADGYFGETGVNIEAAIKALSWERVGYNLTSWKFNDGTPVNLSDLTNFTIPAANTYLVPVYEIQKFTVQFYDQAGTTKVGGAQIIEYGKNAVAPTAPVIPNTAEWKYTFAGWDTVYTNVTKDLNIKALYIQEKQQYTITFLDEDGKTVLGTSKVDYGTAAVAPTITKVGFTWTWDKPFDNVTANADVKIIYTAKKYTVTVFIGNMYYVYDNLAYGATFNILDHVSLTGGNIVLTGNLTVKDSSSTTSKTFYEGTYVVEDVDSVTFDAEYTLIP